MRVAHLRDGGITSKNMATLLCPLLLTANTQYLVGCWQSHMRLSWVTCTEGPENEELVLLPLPITNRPYVLSLWCSAGLPMRHMRVTCLFTA